MKKIYKKEQLKSLQSYPKEVVEAIAKTIVILDESYGVNRDVQGDLGGYVLIAENIVNIQMLKDGILNGVVAEYTDIIKCSGGVNYAFSLFLLSTDYAVVV
ncbi:hypothetical protein GNF79_15735, partial [Clostridium perfringens]